MVGSSESRSNSEKIPRSNFCPLFVFAGLVLPVQGCQLVGELHILPRLHLTQFFLCVILFLFFLHFFPIPPRRKRATKKKKTAAARGRICAAAASVLVGMKEESGGRSVEEAAYGCRKSTAGGSISI